MQQEAPGQVLNGYTQQQQQHDKDMKAQQVCLKRAPGTAQHSTAGIPGERARNSSSNDR